MAIQDYEHHFPPLLPPEDVFPAISHLMARCPVTHSDVDGGFWVLHRYEDNLRALQDWETFAVGKSEGPGAVRIPNDPPGMNRPTTYPVDVNPPIHRAFRQILNPFLSPQRIAAHEDDFRRIIGELLDAALVPEGACDLADAFGKVFPAQLTFEALFGITDQAELTQARFWLKKILCDLWSQDPADLARYQRDFNTWISDFVARRREEPPRGDVIDEILTATIEDGRPLTHDEVMGTVQLLIFGGFSTTADATGSLIVFMIEEGLEGALRSDPSLIPQFIEEGLRLEPPITSRARRCTREVGVGEETMVDGDRLLVSFASANRDPGEFDHPDTFDMYRAANRHLTFGGGVHRCVGSNMARTALRLAIEGLLERAEGIGFPPGQRETRRSFGAGQWRAVDTLPITYTLVAG